MNVRSGNPQLLELITVSEGKVQLPLSHLRSAQWSANAWHHREAGFMAEPVDAVVMQ